jgi:hypothetical protein
MAITITPQPLPTDVPGYPINGIYTLALLGFCVLAVVMYRRFKQ